MRNSYAAMKVAFIFLSDLALDQDFHTSKRINRNFSMIVSTLTKSVNFSFKDQENAAFYMLK